MSFNFRFKVPKVLKSVRYSLAAVNGVFLLTGLLLLIVGVVVLVTYSEYKQLITNRFFSLSSFVVATGVIILLGSVLGFYGAISQQFYFIAGYVVLLLITLVFEIAIVIAAFSLVKDAVAEIRTPMQESLALYEQRLEVQEIWDELQQGFECCGVANRFDWPSTRVPVSCCHIDYGTISPFECTTLNAFTLGCANALGEWLAYNASVIAITALVATCIQILLSLMGAYLAYRSKFEEVELET